MAKKRKVRRDIYQEVTDQILGYLDNGVVPWRNPIAKGAGDGWPKNLQTGKRYRGINVMLLAMKSAVAGFTSDYWMTFKQAQAKNGQVRKGEKGSLVTFWKVYETQDQQTGEPKTLPILRHYTAFNIDQIEGVDDPDAPAEDPNKPPFQPLEKAEAILTGFADPPSVSHDGGSRAFYRAREDSIHLPEPNRFDFRENYYSTLFHEISHSTGVAKRLDRGLDTDPAPFGSPDYSREELVAEIFAAFLRANCGISPQTIEQSAAYLQGWIKVLKGDKRLVVSAAGAAQKSADLILGEVFTSAANGDAAHLSAEQQPVTTAQRNLFPD